MAIEVRPMDCRLQIQLDTGAAADGRRIVRTRTFNRIRSTVSDQDLFDTAAALLGLQTSVPVVIRRIGTEELVNV
jgi:hypothetical protein